MSSLAGFPAVLAAVEVTVWLVRALSPALPWLPRHYLVGVLSILTVLLGSALLGTPRMVHPTSVGLLSLLVALAACGRLHLRSKWKRRPFTPTRSRPSQARPQLPSAARRRRAKGA